MKYSEKNKKDGKWCLCIPHEKNIYLYYLLKAFSCILDEKFPGIGEFKND